MKFCYKKISLLALWLLFFYPSYAEDCSSYKNLEELAHSDNPPVSCVSYLVKQKGIDVNEKNELGQNALIIAVLNVHIELVQALIDEGVDVNAQGEGGLSALMIGAVVGEPKIVQALIEAKADPNLQENQLGATALMLVFAHITEKGEKLDLSNKEKNKLKIIRLIVSAGADLSIVNNFGRNVLMSAVSHDQPIEVIEYLISVSSEEVLNAKEKGRGLTLLMKAAGSGNIEVVSALLSSPHKIDIDAKNNGGTTALMMACLTGRLEVIQALLSAGADETIISDEGLPAGMYLGLYYTLFGGKVPSGSEEFVDSFVAKGVRIVEERRQKNQEENESQ